MYEMPPPPAAEIRIENQTEYFKMMINSIDPDLLYILNELQHLNEIISNLQDKENFNRFKRILVSLAKIGSSLHSQEEQEEFSSDIEDFLAEDEDLLKYEILLSALNALIGEVSPALRAVRVSWDEHKIRLFFYYDGELSEEDAQSAQNISTKMIANFSEHLLDANVIRLDYPDEIPSEGDLIYKRRESQSRY